MNPFVKPTLFMNFAGQTPEPGMMVQVGAYDAEVVEVDERERTVLVAVYDSDEGPFTGREYRY
jgi:hypothetical protein